MFDNCVKRANGCSEGLVINGRPGGVWQAIPSTGGAELGGGGGGGGGEYLKTSSTNYTFGTSYLGIGSRHSTLLSCLIHHKINEFCN